MQYSPIEENVMKAPSLSLVASILLIFLPSFIVFVLLDVAFISLVAGPMFKAALGDITRPVPDLVSGLLAWVVIVGAVQVLALPRATGKGSLMALSQGALVGFFLYATYELTQQSVIATWSWQIVGTDVVWGSSCCAVTCLLMHLLSSWASQLRN
jgi:uncharacterized membrane protein